MKTPTLSLKALLVAGLGCLLLQAEAKEMSLIKGNFANTGVDTDAKGTAAVVFTGNPKFRLDLSNLAPGGTYQLTVDGVLEETLTASARGSVHADFRLNGSGEKLPLDFDPRGKVLDIKHGTTVILSMVFSGEGEPDAIRVDERTSLAPVGTQEGGRVELRYLEQK